MNTLRHSLCIVLGVAILASAQLARSQGIATWLGDRIGAGNVGRALDDANRQAKRAVPIYGQVEEGATGAVRHDITESVVESVAPLLKNLILASRNDALNAGAGPLPPEIVWEFQGFYAQNVLSAYWRVGQGNDLSLQANSFRYGDRAAIVLDTVLVFRNWQDTQSLWLWAHELAHLEQYRAWGIDNFTKLYIRDHQSIENAANRRADEFMAWRDRRMSQVQPQMQPSQVRQPVQQTGQQNGSMCVTPVNRCQWFGPVGWNCVCASPVGLQNGVIR